MVNTELSNQQIYVCCHYNILNIVVNTEQALTAKTNEENYNILNIVVNTELINQQIYVCCHYNILNIVVNTERATLF